MHQLVDYGKNADNRLIMRRNLSLETLELARQGLVGLEQLRIRTNDRMISMFTAMARSLLSTEDSIATPCSVNAYGA